MATKTPATAPKSIAEEWVAQESPLAYALVKLIEPSLQTLENKKQAAAQTLAQHDTRSRELQRDIALFARQEAEEQALVDKDAQVLASSKILPHAPLIGVTAGPVAGALAGAAVAAVAPLVAPFAIYGLFKNKLGLPAVGAACVAAPALLVCSAPLYATAPLWMPAGMGIGAVAGAIAGGVFGGKTVESLVARFIAPDREKNRDAAQKTTGRLNNLRALADNEYAPATKALRLENKNALEAQIKTLESIQKQALATKLENGLVGVVPPAVARDLLGAPDLPDDEALALLEQQLHSLADRPAPAAAPPPAPQTLRP